MNTTAITISKLAQHLRPYKSYLQLSFSFYLPVSFTLQPVGLIIPHLYPLLSHLCAFAQVVSLTRKTLSLISQLVKTQFKCCVIQEEFLDLPNQKHSIPPLHTKYIVNFTADTSFYTILCTSLYSFQHPNNTLLIISPSSFSNEYIYLNH